MHSGSPPIATTRRRRRLALALALAALCTAPPLLRAQTPATGALRGRVLDESGAPIPGALVAVANEATGISRSTRSDAQGRYVLPELPLTGSYDLHVERDGFTTQEQAGIELVGGRTAEVKVVLKAAGVAAQMTVFGAPEAVQSDSPQLGDRFDSTTIRETPLLGRKITALPLLDSAVRSARGTGDLFLDETLFVIDGGGRRQTTFTVDGGRADDAWGRQTIFAAIPLGAIQELTVLTNSFGAEYGRSAGAAVNLVTRAGTNQLRGDLVALSRPGGLQQDAPITHATSHDELTQGSAFLSGAIAKDHVYWSVAGERNDQSRDSIITSPLAPGTFTGQYRQTLLFGRLDADLDSQHHLLGRFDLDRFSDDNPQDVVGGITLPSAGRTFRRDTSQAQVGETAVLSDSLYNEARLVWQEGDPITQFSPLDPSTQLVRPGVATEGESRYAFLTNREGQVGDTVSLALGDHFLKLGGDAVRSRSGGNGQEFGAPFVLGQFTFAPGIPASTPTSALTLANVSRFTQGFGNVSYSVDETLWSLFAQDDFRVRNDLVLNFGLRYDRQTLSDDTRDLSPRLGFAYSPGGDPATTVRGGFGIYTTEIPADTAAAWDLNGPTGFFSFSAAPGQLGFPTSLAPLPGFPPGAVLPPRDITIRPGEAGYYSQFFDISKLAGYPDQLENPRTEQTTLGVEHRFTGGWGLSADAVHATTDRILQNIDLNAPSELDRTAPGQTRPASVADLTRPIVPVPNGYRRILATVNHGEAKYDGLQLNLRRSFSDLGSVLLSYTWSHSRNNVEPDAPGGDPNDVHQLSKEWADSLLDERHRAVLSAWVRGPLTLTFGGVAEIASGRPYNITTGGDNNGDGSTADRPVVDGHVISRNAGRGGTLYDLSLFVERDFAIRGTTLTLRAEGFNLTNHANVVGFNGVYGNGAAPLSTFGTPLGGISNVDPGRQLQIEARLRF